MEVALQTPVHVGVLGLPRQSAVNPRSAALVGNEAGLTDRGASCLCRGPGAVFDVLGPCKSGQHDVCCVSLCAPRSWN